MATSEQNVTWNVVRDPTFIGPVPGAFWIAVDITTGTPPRIAKLRDEVMVNLVTGTYRRNNVDIGLVNPDIITGLPPGDLVAAVDADLAYMTAEGVFDL